MPAAASAQEDLASGDAQILLLYIYRSVDDCHVDPMTPG